MTEENRTRLELLKANIEKEEDNIAQIYARLESQPTSPETDEQTIVVAYYLHNLYSAFEQVAILVARTFENNIEDRSKWHSLLLRQMTLDIPGIRPNLFCQETYSILNRLRSFRHVFRAAYVITLDSDEIDLLYKKAQKLKLVYPPDLTNFKDFLDTL